MNRSGFEFKIGRKSLNSQPHAPTLLIPNLLDELALHCLARVPRQYHHILSAVSKPFRSAVSSPGFFDLRSRLGVSDKVLYVRVRSPFQVSTALFAIYRSDQGGLLRVPAPPHPVEGICNSAAVAFGTSIYVIGGWAFDSASSLHATAPDVWVLDCRSNAWSRGPSMSAGRSKPLSADLGGKIYVFGGGSTVRTVGAAATFAEVLDVSSGRWESLPEPPEGAINHRLRGVVAEGGVIRVWGDLVELRFDPAKWEWAEPIVVPYKLGSLHDWCLFEGAVHVVDISEAKIKRLDGAGNEWKKVEGVAEALPERLWLGPKLVSVGGGRKVMVMMGRGAGSHEDASTMTNNVRWWWAESKYPFEAWIAEIEVSENGAVGRVVWSEKILSQHREGMINCYSPVQYFHDWNIFQVSL